MDPLRPTAPIRLDFAGPESRGVWLNPPPSHRSGGGLHLETGARTDFWQRTHYGFRHDDGHFWALLVAGDFTLEARARWTPRAQYDHCGLMVRAGPESWIKCSVEREDDRRSYLGSVVTNLGFSDWATQEVGAEVREMSYRVSRRDDDFLVECASDGTDWHQLRVAHLHGCPEVLSAGVYACSPVGERFACTFEYLELRPCGWAVYAG
ncbi:MAG TPA: DUF1349 domain-containing protein [Anaeromyxobacteraceae bacterium]|nr:DUF1349 domain-containing protein [Anaeromyxobacteraceae bacterium]